MSYRFREADKTMTEWMKKEFGEDCFDIPVRTIQIQPPVAFKGDEVLCQNYRIKTDIDHVEATVIKVETIWTSETDFYHRYHVKPHDKSYRLVVDHVQKIADQ